MENARTPEPVYDWRHAWLLGLHGLTLLLVFPLGPQQNRLWHPGVAGIAETVAAYPLAALIGGLLARRLGWQIASLRHLALLAGLAALPTAFSTGYGSFLVGRLVAGLAAGASFVSIYRLITGAEARHASRVASRVVAFGMPVGILAATWLDWRVGFALLGLGFLGLGLSRKETAAEPRKPEAADTVEPLPGALLATAALSLVSASYLTVLSGFLVFNAGHTEYHISAALVAGAGAGLAMPPLLRWLGARVSPSTVWGFSLALSLLSITGLLALRGPIPAELAVGLVAMFLATQSARYLALGGLVHAKLADAALPVHQTNTHLAHHLGSGLGACVAGLLVFRDTQSGTLEGMTRLWLVAVFTTAAAWLSGLALAQPKLRPAASAAAEKSFLRTAASWVRSVQTSITRTPGSPT